MLERHGAGDRVSYGSRRQDIQLVIDCHPSYIKILLLSAQARMIYRSEHGEHFYITTPKASEWKHTLQCRQSRTVRMGQQFSVEIITYQLFISQCL